MESYSSAHHQVDGSAAFGSDRTNANSAPPRPSKRAPAGARHNLHSSVGTNVDAPEFVPYGGDVSPFVAQQTATWAPPPATTAARLPQTAPPVSSPTSANPGAAPSAGSQAAQLEAFKSMIFQMANFFQQNPDINTLPTGLDQVFSQLSVGSQPQHAKGPQVQQAPARAQPLHTDSLGLFASRDASVASFGFPPQASVSSPSSQHPAGPFTASAGTMPMVRDDAILEISGPCGPQFPQAPRPNRRSLAQAQESSHPFHQVALSQQQQPQQQQTGSNRNHGGRTSGQGGQQHARPRSTGYTSPYTDADTRIIVLVEFKRQRMKKYDSEFFVAPGNYVVVEGDRGVDCGFVIHSCQREPDGTYSRQESIDNVSIDVSRIKSESGRVLRMAREDDIKLLHGEIASSELIALKTCRELAARMNLNMEIVDCEYQFDRKKISFYFEAPHSVDFRELNTELFRIFGVRIWLENLNSKVKNVVPEGALSHADKLQFTKNGLRPPRRT